MPDETQARKPRLPVEAILHENEYDEDKYKTLLPQYDETIQRYYQERSTNQKVATWTQQMATFLRKPRRADLKDVLAKKGFLFK